MSQRLASLAFFAVVLGLGTPGHGSPLRDRISDLACGDRATRRAALDQLERAPRGELGLPDESLAAPARQVDGHLVDRLLDALAGAREQMPDAAARIDALVASWDYCAVTAGERIWSVWLDGATVSRAQVGAPTPLAGRGFAAWGLIPRVAAGRPVITIAGGEVGTCEAEFAAVTPSGPLPASPVVIGSDESCVPPPRPRSHGAADPDRDVPIPAPRPRPPPPRGPLHASVLASTGTTMPVTLGITVTPFLRQALTRKLDGGVAVSWVPRPGWFIRAAATWQLAVEFSRGPSAVPTWSWGLGYDDWHPGTWSLQLNQWGPVVPADGWWMVRTAALELAYKLALGARLERKLGVRLAVTTPPLSLVPVASAGLTLKLPRAVFASVSIAERLLDIGRPSWTYVIGRSTWMPGSLSLILANFGPNPVPQRNFVAHTTLTVSWSWAW